MLLLGLTLFTALFQVVCGNAIRLIQARSGDAYFSVFSNYVVAFFLAVAFCLLSGAHADGWEKILASGVFTGFFYTAALIAVIRSMNQRGMALTVALSSMSMLVPVLMAVAFGEHPPSLQVAGILIAVAATPFLSLATVSGTGIRERPGLPFAALLFLLQGMAMSGNLIASRIMAPASMPAYLSTLFGSGVAFSLCVWLILGKKGFKGDIRRGAFLGLFNISSTITIILALAHVQASTYFAAVGMTVLVLTALIAAWLWRERMQLWGWIGLGLAVLATPLLICQ